MKEYFTPPPGFNIDFIMGPVKLGLVVFIVSGGLLILGALVYLIWHCIRSHQGQCQLEKRVIIRFATVLLVGIALTGGSFFNILKTGQKMFVTPGANILEQSKTKVEIKKTK